MIPNSIIVLLLLLGLATAAPASESPSGSLAPTSLIDKYAAFLLTRQRCEIESEESIADEFLKGHVRRPADILQIEYYRDGDRFDVRVHRNSNNYRSRSIVDGWFISYEPVAANHLARWAFFRPNGPKGLPFAVGNHLAAFEGFVAENSVNLLDILRNAKQSTVAAGQEIDGRSCVLLTSISEAGGKSRIWFDPEAGYCTRKIIVEKGPQDQFSDGKSLIDHRWRPVGSERGVTSVGYSYTLDNVVGQLVNGVWFPATCRVTTSLQFEDGNAQIVTSICKVTKATLLPAGDTHSFMPELEEGSKLQNLDDRSTSFKWSGGRPIVQKPPGN
jgi:hypothetical protein